MRKATPFYVYQLPCIVSTRPTNPAPVAPKSLVARGGLIYLGTPIR